MEKCEHGDATGAAPEKLYSTQDVSRLTGADTEQLRRWHRSGLLRVRRGPGRRLAYAFRDLVAARAVIALVRRGARAHTIRQAVEAIRAWRPNVDQPLSALRVLAEGNHVVVHMDDTVIEPRSGQLRLTLSLSSQTSNSGHVVSIGRENEDSPDTAAGWATLGIAAERRGELNAAESAYRHAIALDSTHAGSLVNLGNLLFGRGRHRAACELYRAATQAAPTLASAWYNLGNTFDELEQVDAAVSSYKTALQIDPTYADAHFNLALVWEKQGLRDRARPYWRTYLELEPDHPSATTARAFLHEED